MSTTPPGTESARDHASRLHEAAFVRIVTRADADGLAAAGTLARVLSATDVPFQASAARTVAGRRRRLEDARSTATEGDAIALIGDADGGAGIRIDGPGRPASVAAWTVAREIGEPGTIPDPTLALAGAVAGGANPTVADDPAGPVLSAATDRGLVERRPGVGIPTEDPVDGLAHSTLVHAPFSGDPAAVAEELGDVAGGTPTDEAGHRRLASAVALSAVGADEASERGATTVERALRPHALESGPVATVEGYADLLAAVAREEPGTGLALVLGHGAVDPALSAWRERGRAAHRGVRAATTARYDGLLAARLEDGPVETVARLLWAYRSPEPVVLVVSDAEAAAVGNGDEAEAALAAAVETVGGEYDAGDGRAYARVEDDSAATIAAFREALGA